MAENQSPESSEDKFHDPTERHLDDARKEGNVPFSRDVVHWAVIFAGAITCLLIMPSLLKEKLGTLSFFFEYVHELSGSKFDNATFWFPLWKRFCELVFPSLLLFTAAVLIATFLQTKGLVSVKHITPKWNRISPGSGFKRVFSGLAITEFLKNFMKIALLAAVLYGFWFFKALSKDIGSVSQSLHGILRLFFDELKLVFFWSVGVMFFVALLDFGLQRYLFWKKMRMSLQEIKDESKESDGNPEIKQRIRQIRNDRHNRNLVQAISNATAVVTNPTHYAIVLAWREDAMSAPKVTAKGVDFMVDVIRELAKKNQVPIIENPTLARSLYSSVEVDQEIQPQHYKAVAEVIRFVMKLKKKAF